MHTVNIKIKFIYKVCSQKDWVKAISSNIFKGTGIDLIDNFIHFSTQDQLKETLRIHFKGKKNLFLIKVDCKDINIVWEKARNSQYFPHLYGNLNLDKVVGIYPLKVSSNGSHILPSLI
tara:strand:- start:582 stop:938 length:357 start_codon:yes stop_codon:yes gene_type:complete